MIVVLPFVSEAKSHSTQKKGLDILLYEKSRPMGDSGRRAFPGVFLPAPSCEYKKPSLRAKRSNPENVRNEKIAGLLRFARNDAGFFLCALCVLCG
ncbi:MAG: hypothetical protein FWC38_00245 [Proteobacteria bacterium]|nr:hypothetical protein [Pseudomonadota bacterium]